MAPDEPLYQRPVVTSRDVSIVIPAKNEAGTIGSVIQGLMQAAPDAEILVVDDGSTDPTPEIARRAGAVVIRHPVSRGNGAAIKTGARHASRDRLVFMDADGQHSPADVAMLLAQLDRGFDMAVGARASTMHADGPRLLANRVYNLLASLITGVRIADLTSGFRAVRASVFRQFLALLPNGFSYPTTSTMALLRAGYSVCFVPIEVSQRALHTRSHIRPLRDGARFLVIIFKVATLYSPLKIFLPVSFTFFTAGIAYYAYTFLTTGRFTNLGALLFTTSLLVFLIGLVSEQITQLLFVNAAAGSPSQAAHAESSAHGRHPAERRSQA